MSYAIDQAVIDTYPETPTQHATNYRHVVRRNEKPMTAADKRRISDAAERRKDRQRAAD